MRTQVISSYLSDLEKDLFIDNGGQMNFLIEGDKKRFISS